MSRPIEYTKEVLGDIIKKIEEYTDKTSIPIVAEFAYKNNIRKATLYEHPELSYSIKRLIEKKEANLERLALSNEINATMAIFSLKQLGWSDKREVEHSGINPIQIVLDDDNQD